MLCVALQVLRVFYGVHTTVTGANGVQQEQRLPWARVTLSRRGFAPAVVTVIEGQIVGFESVPSFGPAAATSTSSASGGEKEKGGSDKDKEKAKLQPAELPMPPGGYNVVQLSQDGAQFKVMPGGRNFRLESTHTHLVMPGGQHFRLNSMHADLSGAYTIRFRFSLFSCPLSSAA